MPRPKKPGAPEPKKRSRNGCWPCKARKVKCDETPETCLNCQRTGETCDYSIRLNWEGRGKKTNFSANMISVAIAGSSASQPSTLPVAPQAVFQVAPQPVPNPAQIPSDRSSPRPLPPTPYLIQPQNESPRHVASQDMATIDPILTGFQAQPASMYTDSIYGTSYGPPEPHYTQSYERHRVDGPSTPTSATLPMVSRLRETLGPDDAPSPPDSAAQSPNADSFLSRTGAELSSAALPFYHERDSGTAREGDEHGRPTKRRRYQMYKDINTTHNPSMLPPIISPYHSNYGFNDSNPRTPGSSHSEDAFRQYSSAPSPYAAQDSPDLRRLSVNSLLSGPPGISHHGTEASAPRSIHEWHEFDHDVVDYGVDSGYKDLDIPKNDDSNAITGASPVAKRAHLDLILEREDQIEFGFGDTISAFGDGGYYFKPVSVSIPRILLPLPEKLLENPMNLLYFHHFINHTAAALIPHNCSSNPFRRILPQMAVRNDNLLNLLLAYSASHRARLLRQPEPATRIAFWVQDIFPNLRKALNDPNQIISNATLASAIMLASLEIISPKAFGVEVPWQRHLDTARQMIAARGGPKGMRVESRSDMVSDFLWSWFAYLDVLGSLSGGKNSPSSTWVLDYHVEGDTDYAIDCVLGFTSKCVRILAKIADLARACDDERTHHDDEDAEEWSPSEKTVARAHELEAELAESRVQPSKPCTHMQSTGEAAFQWDGLKMDATNKAFHWAGHVHIHRRILGKPSSHPDVRNAVREIFGALYKVRRGSNAEGCLLFPMFTAGCETQDMNQRADILERMKGVERSGMTQVHKARTLMERVWETGKPWETLVAGEFFG